MDKTHENAIKQLAAQVDETWNNGDAAQLASYWDQSGLNVSPMGEAFEGRPAIEANLGESLNGFLKGSKHEMKVDRVYSLNAQTAVADGSAKIFHVFGPDGTEMGPWVSNFTMICTKQEDGTWQIAQMRAYTFLPKQG